MADGDNNIRQKIARRNPWPRALYPIIGLAALVWFLVRVIPKPTRATYPCQRIAAPLASGFIAYMVSIFASVLFFRQARQYLRQTRYLVAFICIACGMFALIWHIDNSAEKVYADFNPTDVNSPSGTAKGIYPGRVVWVHDPDATSWDGWSNYWWSDAYNNQTVIDGMLGRAVSTVAGGVNELASWDALFRDFNQNHGKGGVGYQAGEKIVVKINLNNAHMESYDRQDNDIDVQPQAILALLRQLTGPAGIAEENITVYDAVRIMQSWVYNKLHGEFPNVRYVDSNGQYGRTAVQWTSTYSFFLSNGAWSSRLPTSVVEADYLINLAILKRHNYAAPVTLCMKNNFGTIEDPSALHDYIYHLLDGMGQYDALVDLAGHEHIGGKTLLNIVNGLYGSEDVGAWPATWNLAPFNGDWPSSIFVSLDPVAIESVCLDFLRSEMELWDYADNYLHEAARADNPPSGTFYDPEDDGSRLPSLGVHEHWNNSTDKEYTRNLGTGNGIELVYLFGAEETGSIVLDSGDYNGDGTDDIAVFRPSSGLWAVRGLTRVYYGSSSDRPVPGDYNCDGVTDIGIFRDSSGLWAVRGVTRIYFGQSSDTAVPFTLNPSSACTPGIFRSLIGLWAIRGLTRSYFGSSDDRPIPGDYDGDGTKEIGIFRESSGLWALQGISRVYFGSSGDGPVPGDYDGNGTWDVGIFRESSGLWAIRGVTRVYFGSSSDQPVPADYSGNSSDDIGIFRDSSGLWAARGITRVYFGTLNDIPVIR